MNNTKAVLVLGIFGLLAAVAVAVGGAMLWWDQGPADIGNPTRHPEPDRGAMGTADRLTGDAGRGDAGRDTGADRQQVIEGPSGKRRPASLLFRCQTLRQNVAGVWNHMQLKVRVEDQAGQHLDECQKPWLPWTAAIPVGVQRIVLVAKGYKRQVVSVPPVFHKGVRPTVMVLEPDATARVRAIHLPWTPGNEFQVSARLATGTDKAGKPLLFAHAGREGKGTEAVRGEVATEVKVPSGLAVMFIIRRTKKAHAEADGFLTLESDVVTLAAGEERGILIDLRTFGVLEGRVTGLARPALRDQVLFLRPATRHDANRGRLEGAWGRLPGRGVSSSGGNDTTVRLDAEGNFRFHGLTHKPFTLELVADGGGWPALEEVGSGRRQWSLDEVGFLVVEPASAVHGVVPVKQGALLDRPFHVQANTPPSGGLTRRIPLFTPDLLQKASLFFYVQGIGHFDRSLAGKLPDPDGLHRVEVPVPGGTLVVHVENSPGPGTHLFARPLAAGDKQPWISITGRRANDDWRFEGLAPGDYKLVVNYTARHGNLSVHGGRVLPQTIAVKSGQETKVTIRIPDLIEVTGEVANWSQIPETLTPRWLQLSHGGRPHTARLDKNGHFKLTVMGPWEGVSEVTFFSYGGMLANLQTTDVTWLPAEKRLSVMFPGGIRERRIAATPMAGGRLWMHAYLAADGTPLRRSPRRHGRHVSPRKDNLFVIAEDPHGVDCLLLEQFTKDGQNTRLLRGWLRLAPGGPEQLHFHPKGRFIQVSSTSGQANLTLKPPSWWSHPPYPWATLRLSGTAPHQLWIPDGATALLINNHREIPTSEIGKQLVIE